MKQLTAILYIAAVLLPAVSGCKGKKDENTVRAESAKNKYTRASTQEMEAKGIKDLDKASDLKTILCQNWDNEEDATDASSINPDTDLEILFRGYSFFNDGTMVKDPRGDYEQGTWELHDAAKPYVIEMKYTGGTQEFFPIAKADPRSLTLNEVTTLTSSIKKLVDYEGEAIAHNILDKEPFHGSNNAWRIKPVKSELEGQLKARLKGMIHFYILFYDQCIDARSEKVNFTGLPSCYKWYAGGIFIKKEKELSPNWINCFYDKKQAMAAYKIAGDLVDKKYKWPKGETNWLKQNVFVLRQMEKNL